MYVNAFLSGPIRQRPERPDTLRPLPPTARSWKRTLCAGLLCLFTAAALLIAGDISPARAESYEPGATRTEVDLNDDWKFLREDAPDAEQPDFDDSAWESVSVPHTWNAKDAQDGGGDQADDPGYYRGTGWYRRHYTPPASFDGQKLWLQFDAVSLSAKVYVNGESVGEHSGGFGRFRLDASSLVPGADNVIAVEVTNAEDPDVPPLAGDFPVGGGIHRGVSLVVTDPLQIRTTDYGGPGVYVRQRQIAEDAATVDVTTKTWNNHTDPRSTAVRTVITDDEGTVVAQATSAAQDVAGDAGRETVQQLTIDQPRLWNGTEDPYRYTVHAELVDVGDDTTTDRVTVPLGLRTFSSDADEGFSLNGEHLPLRGVNAHQDRLDKGWAVSEEDRDEDFRLMDEMGVNALRTAHYQQAESVYDRADESGYVVWAEVPLVDEVTDSDAFTENSVRQLRELIRQNHHHPSVVFWGIGNEQRTDDEATNDVLAELAGTVAEEDPDRLSTYASNLGEDAEVGKHTEVMAFNKYFGWYESAGIDGFGPWADQVHANQPQRPFGVSEYGAGASIHQHAEDPENVEPGSRDHPEEYQSKVHERSWAQIEERPYLYGTFVWVMFDFASDWRDEGDTPGRNDKGLVTYDRKDRKDAFYFYKANWNTEEDTTHLNSKRWTDRTEATTTVRVYSTGEEVRLRLNGEDLGTMTGHSHHTFTQEVELAPGTNEIEVTGSNGVEDSASWELDTARDG